MKDKIKIKSLIWVLFIAILLVANIGFVMAHENFEETKQLIDSNISCDELTNEQLEEIGDYLMEQMHPGESHEAMDEMMGGEESESLRLMHINMAKMMYCNNGEGMNNMMNMMSSGMMNGMGGEGMMNGNMMSGRGMMGSGNMMSGRGMMGSGNMMSGRGMMGGGMMGNNMMGNNMMGSGMTGNWQYGYGYWSFINILYIALLIGLVILVYFFVIKLWRK